MLKHEQRAAEAEERMKAAIEAITPEQPDFDYDFGISDEEEEENIAGGPDAKADDEKSSNNAMEETDIKADEAECIREINSCDAQLVQSTLTCPCSNGGQKLKQFFHCCLRLPGHILACQLQASNRNECFLLLVPSYQRRGLA